MKGQGGERRSGGQTAIEARLAAVESRLSTGRLNLVQAILENPDETYFLSSRGLARRFEVDPSTVVRTVQALGYERYADFAADLREHFVARITPYRILEATTREKGGVADHVQHSLERDMRNLNQLRSQLNPGDVVAFARSIQRASRVLVVGVDLAASLAGFLAYGLAPLGLDAEAPAGSAGILQHKVRMLTPDDLLVAISFGRCLRNTVEAVLLARDREVPTFGITDSETTPIARHCDKYLVATIASASFSGSYVAPLALLNAVLLACAELQSKRSLELLRQSEREYLSGTRWYESVPEASKHPKTKRKPMRREG